MKQTELNHLIIEFDHQHKCAVFVDNKELKNALSGLETLNGQFTIKSWFYPLTEIKAGEPTVVRSGEYEITVIRDHVRMFYVTKKAVQK